MKPTLGYIITWYFWMSIVFGVGYIVSRWAWRHASPDNYPVPDDPVVLTRDKIDAWRIEAHTQQRKMILNAIIWFLPTLTGVCLMIMGGVGMLLPILASVRLKFS